MSEPHRRIDAHLHLWERGRSSYDWITPQLGALYADFNAPTAHIELQACGIDAAVLVQADDTVQDTTYLFDVAAAHPWVVGVVGWVPLERPALAESLLAEWEGQPSLKGVRQLLHSDPRDVLGQPAVLDTLRLIAEAGLAFDVPDAFPRLMPAIPALADAVPDLTIVVDHLAKPSTDSDQFAAWARALADIAARPTTIAKLSGLQSLTPAARDRAFTTALEAFGPARIAYGSDWPMTVPHGGYGSTWRSMGDLISRLSPAEQHEVIKGTATRAYRLGA